MTEGNVLKPLNGITRSWTSVKNKVGRVVSKDSAAAMGTVKVSGD